MVGGRMVGGRMVGGRVVGGRVVGGRMVGLRHRQTQHFATELALPRAYCTSRSGECFHSLQKCVNMNSKVIGWMNA